MNGNDDGNEGRVTKLIAEFDRATTRTAWWLERYQVNRDARFNRWAGQSPDGKKWKKYLQKEPVPWEGANDARVPMVDSYVNEDVGVLLSAFFKSRLQATPTESNDGAKAAHVTNLLRWLKENQMTELPREAELLAQYMMEGGVGVLGVFWDRRLQMQREEITVDGLHMLAAENPESSLPRFLELLPMDVPELEPELVAVVQDLYQWWMQQNRQELYEEELPGLKAAEARRVIRELREDGRSKLAVPSLVRNRPCVVALRPGEDFFWPADTTTIDSARMLFYVERISGELLEERVMSKGYDERWVKEVKERAKGRHSEMSSVESNRTDHRLPGQSISGQRSSDLDELYELIHVYERRLDDGGVPAIYCSVVNKTVPSYANGADAVGYEEVLDYSHGEYPFLEFEKETLSRRLGDSRGHGEVAFTLQRQFKVELDFQTDRASMTTNPPLVHPYRTPPTKWGPGARIPYWRSPDETRWAEVPKWDRGSQDVQDQVRRLADQYFGRAVEGYDPIYSRIRMEWMVTRWLRRWGQAFTQVFQLCQQYLPEEISFRVIGSRKGEVIRAARQEIQGKFDVALGFNPMVLVPEYAQALLKMISDVVGTLDVNGLVDRDELLSVAFEMLDPNLGERLLRPGENASQQEIEDEQMAVARIGAGFDVDVKPAGQAHALRLQVLEQAFQQPDFVKRFEGDEAFRERIEKRIKQHRHQIEQRQNAVIGRLGA